MDRARDVQERREDPPLPISLDPASSALAPRSITRVLTLAQHYRALQDRIGVAGRGHEKRKRAPPRRRERAGRASCRAHARGEVCARFGYTSTYTVHGLPAKPRTALHASLLRATPSQQSWAHAPCRVLLAPRSSRPPALLALSGPRSAPSPAPSRAPQPLARRACSESVLRMSLHGDEKNGQGGDAENEGERRREQSTSFPCDWTWRRCIIETGGRREESTPLSCGETVLLGMSINRDEENGRGENAVNEGGESEVRSSHVLGGGAASMSLNGRKEGGEVRADIVPGARACTFAPSRHCTGLSAQCTGLSARSPFCITCAGRPRTVLQLIGALDPAPSPRRASGPLHSMLLQISSIQARETEEAEHVQMLLT
ncbi:hypothetical protein DFH09DRAFT_1362547 [Mycena vulgaris]|nr:hypothetical protein DFH09DRAFT_1362547 [Mycena vulgaris]